MTRSQVRTLLGCAIGSVFGYGSVVVVAFALMIPPLMRERGWGQDEVAIVISIKALTAMLVAPLVGRLIDRIGSRTVIAVSALTAATCLWFLGSITNLYLFYLMYGLLIVAASGTMPTSYSHAIVATFDAARGLAIGLVMAAVGIGAIILPPLLHGVVQTGGVASAYHWLAGLGLVAGLAAAILVDPTRIETSDAGAPRESVLAAARSSAGMKLIAISLLLGIFTGATWGQIVPLMLARGVNEGDAAFTMSGLAVAIVLARIASGYLLDRYFAPRVAMMFLLPVVVAWGVLAAGGSGGLAIMSAVALGIGLGAEFDFLAFLAGRYLPRSIFGSFYGLMFSATALGSAASPLIFAQFRASPIGENGALAAMAIAVAGAIAILNTLGRYPSALEGATREAAMPGHTATAG